MSAFLSQKSYYQNKLAIIAGGSEGIGLAAATALAALGSNVCIGSRDAAKRDQARQAMEKVRCHSNQSLAAVPLDVTEYESTCRQMESIVQKLGAPHLLINAAGFAHPGYLQDLDIAVLRRLMEVNYFGTLHTVKALLPAMRQAGRGHIVNISSMAGYLGLFGYAGYCASKCAVIGFSWALRHEVRPYGLSVSVLCPSNTRTPGLERENQIKPKEILAMEEKIQTQSAEDVAGVMLRALPRNPFLIHPTLQARLAYWAARLAPARAADFFLRRDIQK